MYIGESMPSEVCYALPKMGMNYAQLVEWVEVSISFNSYGSMVYRYRNVNSNWTAVLVNNSQYISYMIYDENKVYVGSSKELP
jgi:predicted metallopeptidase